MASAAVRPGRYNLVVYIQSHGLVLKPESQVETRQHGPNYDGLTMTELSIPGDQFIPGLMGSMSLPDEDHPHWLGKSTESVIPGILRAAFMGRCDDPHNINQAFRGVIEELKSVYAAAGIKFKDSEGGLKGGFTVRENPPDHQWWQLRRKWGENRRKTPGNLPKREVSDDFVPMPMDYGVYGVCSDHPILSQFCLTSLKDEDVLRKTEKGDFTSDFIASNLFPKINMIGHYPGGRMFGAQNWIDAIVASNTDVELKQKAIEIIEKAFIDKSLHSQHFITVLQALDIGNVWMINPTCRDLCHEIDAVVDRSPSPRRHEMPDSVSPPRTTPRTNSPSPPPPPPASSWGWSNLFGMFKAPHVASTASSGTSTGTGTGTGTGGSRKSLRRTTSTTRRKITRKTKKTAYKRKSQKRNRRK